MKAESFGVSQWELGSEGERLFSVQKFSHSKVTNGQKPDMAEGK
jgi:hypothetical protein